MPPRYAYWTILIDNRPTAFRAATRDELQPTLFQLRRTNPDTTLKWFARGRMWESPEAEREAQRLARSRVRERPEQRGGIRKGSRFKRDGSRKPRRG